MISVIEKWHFLHFISWCGDIFQVTSTSVKFPQESVYQKLLKSVYFWQSYSKNIKGDVFRGTKCRNEPRISAVAEKPRGNRDFKVTPVVDAEYLRNGTKYTATIELY